MCAIPWTKSIPSSLLSVIKGEERDGGGGGSCRIGQLVVVLSVVHAWRRVINRKT